MGNDPGEAVFHAGMLLQLYDETKNVKEVRRAATALLATRPADHVGRVAWFLPAELLPVLPKHKRKLEKGRRVRRRTSPSSP